MIKRNQSKHGKFVFDRRTWGAPNGLYFHKSICMGLLFYDSLTPEDNQV